MPRAPYDTTCDFIYGALGVHPGVVYASQSCRFVRVAVPIVSNPPLPSRVGYVTLDGPPPNEPGVIVFGSSVFTDYRFADFLAVPHGSSTLFQVLFVEKVTPFLRSPYFRVHVGKATGLDGSFGLGMQIGGGGALAGGIKLAHVSILSSGRERYDTTVDFVAGGSSLVPGLRYLSQNCRLVPSQVPAIGPYPLAGRVGYVTLTFPPPTPAVVSSGDFRYLADYGFADLLCIPTGSPPNFQALYVERVAWRSHPPYFRVYVRNWPFVTSAGSLALGYSLGGSLALGVALSPPPGSLAFAGLVVSAGSLALGYSSGGSLALGVSLLQSAGSLAFAGLVVPGSLALGYSPSGSLALGGSILGSLVLTGVSSPGSLALGSALPGSLALGSALPGSLAPGSDLPGSLALGSALPGSLVLGSVLPGSLALASSLPGSLVLGSGASWFPGPRIGPSWLSGPRWKRRLSCSFVSFFFRVAAMEVCSMAQLYPNEGLVADALSLARGSQSGVDQLFCDLILSPAGVPSLASTWASMTFGFLSGSFSAVSANAGLGNFVHSSDFTVQALIGNVGIIQASPITFTNTTGSPIVIYGFAIYQTTTLVAGNPTLLVSVQGVPGGSMTIPAGGTVVFTPILGSSSQLSS